MLHCVLASRVLALRLVRSRAPAVITQWHIVSPRCAVQLLTSLGVVPHACGPQLGQEGDAGGSTGCDIQAARDTQVHTMHCHHPATTLAAWLCKTPAECVPA